MTYRFNPYTAKQFPTSPHMQVGERADGYLESIHIQSQSLPIRPIEGQNLDLHEQQ